MTASRAVIAFSGAVRCRREDGTLGLILEGRTADAPHQEVSLVFSLGAGVPPRLPEILHELVVEQMPGHDSYIEAGNGEAGPRRELKGFRLHSAEGEWVFRALAYHLHREVSESFYRAIPPRSAPWSKVLFWRIVLALAARPAGKRLLLALRRH